MRLTTASDAVRRLSAPPRLAPQNPDDGRSWLFELSPEGTRGAAWLAGTRRIEATF
jgi:hypothetical protein